MSTSTGISGSSSVWYTSSSCSLVEQVPKQRRELTGEVRALAGVVDRGFDRHVGERHRLRAAAADVLLA